MTCLGWAVTASCDPFSTAGLRPDVRSGAQRTIKWGALAANNFSQMKYPTGASRGRPQAALTLKAYMFQVRIWMDVLPLCTKRRNLPPDHASRRTHPEPK